MLQQLLEQQDPTSLTAQIEEIRQQCDRVSDCDGDHQRHATVVYEFIGTSSHIEPRLRLSIKHPTDATDIASGHTTTPDSILEALQLRSQALESNKALVDICYSSTKYVRCVFSALLLIAWNPAPTILSYHYGPIPHSFSY